MICVFSNVTTFEKTLRATTGGSSNCRRSILRHVSCEARYQQERYYFSVCE